MDCIMVNIMVRNVISGGEQITRDEVKKNIKMLFCCDPFALINCDEVFWRINKQFFILDDVHKNQFELTFMTRQHRFGGAEIVMYL